jgi:hypothetical protein
MASTTGMDRTMKLIVLTRNNPDADRTPHVEEEYRLIDELRTKGVIEQIFLRLDGLGSVVVCEDDSGQSLRARLEKLPFIRNACVQIADVLEASLKV